MAKLAGVKMKFVKFFAILILCFFSMRESTAQARSFLEMCLDKNITPEQRYTIEAEKLRSGIFDCKRLYKELLRWNRISLSGWVSVHRGFGPTDFWKMEKQLYLNRHKQCREDPNYVEKPRYKTVKDCWGVCERCENVTFYADEIVDLSPYYEFTHIESFRVRGLPKVKDLSFVQNFPKLKFLTIQETSVQDFSFLEKMKSRETLESIQLFENSHISKKYCHLFAKKQSHLSDCFVPPKQQDSP
jgi:hypothetical protein